MYYFYAVYLDTLQDVYKFPLAIDDYPADNDARRIFIGGLVQQQTSLTLVNDVVYAGFGGLCDAFNYTGTAVAININTRWINRWVTQAGPGSSYSDDWTLKHGGGAAGISQVGMSLASDGQDVFFSVDGGGTSSDQKNLTTPISGHAHQDVLSSSAVRVKLADDGVQFVDFFRPFDYPRNESQSTGSGGFSILDSTAFGRLGVTGRNSALYIHDLENLGGYRQGVGSSDGVLQSLSLDGVFSGGIGSYPLEGGYIYANTENGSLSAYKFVNSSPSNSSASLFTFAGKAATTHSVGAGIPTVTSKNGEPGTGIVWLTDPTRGLLAYKAVPVNGSLAQVKIGTGVNVQGSGKYSRPVFGDGKVYVFDGIGSLVALGVK